MIVTHASSNDDARFATKLGVDEAVRFARSRRIPLVYLQDDREPAAYFMEDCEPDYWVRSEGGELGFDVGASHVYVVGGHLEECLSFTLNEILDSWARGPRRDLTITLFMDAIFSATINVGGCSSVFLNFTSPYTSPVPDSSIPSKP